jgi:Tfp pilus assembly protein PilZ
VPKVLLIAALLGSLLLSAPRGDSDLGQEKTGGASAAEAAVKVTVTTGGGVHGPVKSQYRVGEDIPIMISLTNIADRPQKYCLSTSVFQDRPQLTKDGQLVPYVTDLVKVSETEEYVQRCETNAGKKFYELQPKQTKAVDWISLSRGVNWYGNLTPGHYELILSRRVVCCQGPFVESNKISFDIVP